MQSAVKARSLSLLREMITLIDTVQYIHLTTV